MYKSHENQYNTSVQFNLFAKNCHQFTFKFFVDSHQFNLKFMGYSTEITIFGIIRLKTKMSFA